MSDLELVKEVEQVYSEAALAVLVTVIESADRALIGQKMLIEFTSLERYRVTGEMLRSWLANRSGNLIPLVVERARALALEEESRLTSQWVEDDRTRLRLMMELMRAEPQLIICGAGHVGQALAPMARLLDLDVTVIDDRADYASRDLFPDEKITLVVQPFAVALQSMKITPSTSIVIVTRGHKQDEVCLKIALDTPARYIGMIGSPRRVITVFRMLGEEGVSLEALKRVHAPIGLDIGARTPAEIAVSILAEIVLTKYGGTGHPKCQEVQREAVLKKI
jgi:xanthine dehydrogenase accessory factor